MKLGLNYRFGGGAVVQRTTDRGSPILISEPRARARGFPVWTVQRLREAPCSGPYCGVTVSPMADALNPQTALPTAADVEAAAGRLAGVALRTPLINSPVLDAAVGARVFLKAETLQRTGSFKFRGAYNKLSSIPQERRVRRRGRLFLRQPCAGRRRGGATARHAGGDRDAVGRAAAEARAHRGARRRDRAL